MANVPGGNLLKKAQRLIRPVSINYYKFTGRTTNSAGLDVNTFDTVTALTATVQAVPRKLYDRMGLDYTKRYISIWSVDDIDTLYRDRAGDNIGFNGRRYSVLDDADWTSIDGWNSMVAIDIGTDV